MLSHALIIRAKRAFAVRRNRERLLVTAAGVEVKGGRRREKILRFLRSETASAQSRHPCDISKAFCELFQVIMRYYDVDTESCPEIGAHP